DREPDQSAEGRRGEPWNRPRGGARGVVSLQIAEPDVYGRQRRGCLAQGAAPEGGPPIPGAERLSERIEADPERSPARAEPPPGEHLVIISEAHLSVAKLRTAHGEDGAASLGDERRAGPSPHLVELPQKERLLRTDGCERRRFLILPIGGNVAAQDRAAA